MKLNTRKPFQRGAVLLALVMLASYVVYSQRQAPLTMAPSSKSLILDRTAIQMQAPGTNQPLLRSTLFVAPGSKSMAPILTIPVTNSSKATKSRLTDAPAPMLFPGSKSAAVFHPHDVSVLLPAPVQPHPLPEPLPYPREAPKPPAFSATTNTTASLNP
jgi:hypothetical protein